MSVPQRSTLRQLLLGEFTLKRFVRSLIFIYLFFAAYVFVAADSMIFIPPESSYEDTPEVIKVVDPRSSQTLSALYLPALPAVPSGDRRITKGSASSYTLLYSHGNAEDLGFIRANLLVLQQAGLSVFAYDYPGYGTSEGHPTERSVYGAIDAAYAYLTETLQVPADHIIVYGRSVGGGPSTYLASHRAIAGLILESTFTSAFRTVIPVPILPFDKFPNARRLKEIQVPTLVIHGTEDTVIPFSHGEALFRLLPGIKQFFPVNGAGHNDVVGVAGDRYLEVLQTFLQSVTTAEGQHVITE